MSIAGTTIETALREREARFTDDAITGPVDDPATFYHRRDTKPETATCTICAAVESPGFYTGCILNDGVADGKCEWTCDGQGSLTRRVIQ
ncbi:hypothetical protein [Rhodopseudomonas palustris]|uniref:hypothetical protein n=1 Tax=Rhodopseudomonas palustris TaxID=1076 RepID=UPI0006418FDC|nr:hypothetical protein [Rhodopseudomonas palustris]